jgi:hypothetical protein
MLPWKLFTQPCPLYCGDSTLEDLNLEFKTIGISLARSRTRSSEIILNLEILITVLILFKKKEMILVPYLTLLSILRISGVLGFSHRTKLKEHNIS